MAKKLLKKKVSNKSTVEKVAAPVVDSAKEIWLAGLGAFNIAQQESGRIIEQGSKLFDKLVAEGSKLEKKTRKDVGEVVEDFRGEVETRVEGIRQQADAVRKQASDNWDKLERIFEDRVARALTSMGIPSKDDVNDLADKVQKLARQVAEMHGKGTPVKARPVVKKATRKVVRKSATKSKGAGN